MPTSHGSSIRRRASLYTQNPTDNQNTTRKKIARLRMTSHVPEWKKSWTFENVELVEAKGLRIDAMRMMRIDEELAGRHYAEHREKPFFGELVDFITSAPTLALVLEGESAISVVRTTMGATNPTESAPGTIRGDLALAMPDNLVHGSDSPESAQRELELWFGD